MVAEAGLMVSCEGTVASECDNGAGLVPMDQWDSALRGKCMSKSRDATWLYVGILFLAE